MRRLLTLPAVAVSTLALAACGGGDAGGSGGGDSLGFLPKDPFLVIALETDPESAQVKTALELVRGFPGGGLALGQAEDGLFQAEDALTFQDDLRPQLGNPLYVALTDTSGDEFVAGFEGQDADGVEKLFARSEARKVGEQDGYTIYRDGDSFAALDGAQAVLASSRQGLDAALTRSADDSGMTSDGLDALRGDLPEDPLVLLAGDVTKSLEAESAADARKVPWVRALRGYGVAVTAAADGVTVDFRADTGGRELASEDRPLTEGQEAPAVAAVPDAVPVGLRDMAQTIGFALGTAEALDPAGYEDFTANLDRIKGATGVDVREDIVNQLTGDSTVAVAIDRVDLTPTVSVRVGVEDPTAFARALDDLGPLISGGLEGAGVAGAEVSPGPEGLQIVEQGGSPVGAFGVVDGDFVAGNASARELLGFARRPTAPVAAAEGPFAVTIPGETLGRLVQLAAATSGLPSGLVAIAAGNLGDFTGWMRNDAKELTGSFTQSVR